MALLKSVKTDYGIDATYWNIFSILENFKNKKLEVVIAGYASKVVRDANLDPIAWQNLQISGEEYIKDATRSNIYETLKSKDFLDALDI